MNSLGLQNLSFKESKIFLLMPSSRSPTGHKFEKRGRFPTDLISELQLLIIIVSGNSSAFATMSRNEREFKFVISPFFSLAFFTTGCHFNESTIKIRIQKASQIFHNFFLVVLVRLLDTQTTFPSRRANFPARAEKAQLCRCPKIFSVHYFLYLWLLLSPNNGPFSFILPSSC